MLPLLMAWRAAVSKATSRWWGAQNLISTQVSGVSVAMGDALQPGDLLVTIKEASTTEADDDDEALAA